VQPLVTAVIPTQNRSGLLSQALNSVIAQEGTGEQFDLEVIVVDDGSSDDTAGLVARYPSVRYIRLEPSRGVSAARNVGIKASTGKYIAFLDDDDLWLPEKLKRQVRALEAEPDVGVAYSQCHQRNRQGKVREVVLPDSQLAPSGQTFREFVTKGEYTIFHLVTALVRRTAFEKAGYFDETLSICEDYDMWLRLAFHVRFEFLPGPVAIWRPGHGLSRKAAAWVDQVHRRVQDRTLTEFLNSKAEEHIRREARARSGIKYLPHLAQMGESARLREYLEEALRLVPGLVNDPATCRRITAASFELARTAVSPLAAIRGICDAIIEGIRGASVGRMQVRRLLADVWLAAVRGLRTRKEPSAVSVCYAAMRALRLDPFTLRRKGLALLALRALVRNPRAILLRVGGAAFRDRDEVGTI